MSTQAQANAEAQRGHVIVSVSPSSQPLTASFSFSAALYARRQARTYLEEMAFRYPGRFEFLEHKGWGSSKFSVRGEGILVANAFQAIKAWTESQP